LFLTDTKICEQEKRIRDQEQLNGEPRLQAAPLTQDAAMPDKAGDIPGYVFDHDGAQ
jgi:hypothetical protein